MFRLEILLWAGLDNFDAHVLFRHLLLLLHLLTMLLLVLLLIIIVSPHLRRRVVTALQKGLLLQLTKLPSESIRIFLSFLELLMKGVGVLLIDSAWSD